MRALGVAPLAGHLRARLSLSDAIAAAKSDTRKYAKRQRTWLRRNMISWKAVNTQQIERMIDDSLSFIDH